MNTDRRYELKCILNNAELSDVMFWIYGNIYFFEKYKKRDTER
mgnify:CR=1 FL=1